MLETFMLNAKIFQYVLMLHNEAIFLLLLLLHLLIGILLKIGTSAYLLFGYWWHSMYRRGWINVWLYPFMC